MAISEKDLFNEDRQAASSSSEANDAKPPAWVVRPTLYGIAATGRAGRGQPGRVDDPPQRFPARALRSVAFPVVGGTHDFAKLTIDGPLSQ